MSEYTPIQTTIGELYGRDTIFLVNVSFKDTPSVVHLKCSVAIFVSNDDERCYILDLEFMDILSISVIELDSWLNLDKPNFLATSSFYEVKDSKLIKRLGGKVKDTDHHIVIQTYDYVFEVVCSRYRFNLVEDHTIQ